MQDTSSVDPRQLAQRRGDYGFDAPYVPIIFLSTGLLTIALSLFSFFSVHDPVSGIIWLVIGIYMLLSGASYIYTTRRGKFHVWAELLTELKLSGNEQILDMGCGRGAVLLMVASLLNTGKKAIGVDIWSTRDQSGNAQEATMKNAQLEEVSEKIELATADMRELPYANDTFDLILSSLAIHNISASSGRDKALDEAVRVLKPGGRLIIADISATKRYAKHLRELGMVDVSHKLLNWRFWYGAPWVMTHLVQAYKPV